MKEYISNAQWPPQSLEVLGRCPVCGCEDTHEFYSGLTDDAFSCAPGKWQLQRCEACTSAFLDPRPDGQSIGLAYGSYYTHAGEASREDYERLGALRRFRRRVSNSYTNRRYGTSHAPSGQWLSALLRWLPMLRQGLDVQYRWLPKPSVGDKLLDVGCGNGAFLGVATSCGWEAYGVDPDPEAIRQAPSQAKQVRLGGIDVYADMAGEFKAVTLSHSIEHVHDPVQVLKDAYRLLDHGGVLYVDTPNIDSRGRVKFGRHWRGLETPRHLVLFTLSGLEEVLEREGFTIVSRHRRTSVAAGMFSSSQLIAQGQSPYDEPSSKLKLQSRVWAALFIFVPSSRLEFITLVAKRISR